MKHTRTHARTLTHTHTHTNTHTRTRARTCTQTKKHTLAPTPAPTLHTRTHALALMATLQLDDEYTMFVDDSEGLSPMDHTGNTNDCSVPVIRAARDGG